MTQPDLAFTLERSYPVAPDRVWAHFTQPELMAQWFCPNPTLETTCTLDVRPGGAWRCDMGPHAVSGTFAEVEPTTRLVFTWGWDHDDDPDTTVTVTLEPEGAGTKLVLAHSETVPGIGADGHEGGWTRTLQRLAELLG